MEKQEPDWVGLEKKKIIIIFLKRRFVFFILPDRETSETMKGNKKKLNKSLQKLQGFKALKSFVNFTLVACV